MSNKYTIAAFSVCFAVSIFAASQAQIGPAPGSGGTAPGGLTTQVQYNNAGAFGGDAGLVYNDSTNNLSIINGLLTIQWSASVNDQIFTNGSGTFVGRTNLGTKYQFVVADGVAGLRQASGSNLAWNSATTLDSGSIDTGLNRNAAGVIEANNGTAGTYREIKIRSAIIGGTVPGISGCTAGTQTGGGTAGTYTSGTTGACTVVLTLAFTAPTGWSCWASDRTTPANLISQSASSTTTATLTGTTVSGDVISYGCLGY